jgi:citrate lyase beta subunit
VYINFDDPAGLEADTLRGKRLGFLGKHAIHPSQISIIERVYLPTPAEVERARRIVETFEAAEQAGQAAIGFDGELVDYPLAERSRRLLALAGDMSLAKSAYSICRTCTPVRWSRRSSVTSGRPSSKLNTPTVTTLGGGD